jgi:hypothetical protein
MMKITQAKIFPSDVRAPRAGMSVAAATVSTASGDARTLLDRS